MRKTAVNFAMLSALCVCLTLSVSGLPLPLPIYPGSAGRLGGTLEDNPYDGNVDTADWTFNGYGPGWEGAITLLTENRAELERRVVWEYDLSSVTYEPPLTATLVFHLRGAPIFPFPDIDVHVYAYVSDLLETLADYDSQPAVLQGVATVSPLQEREYRIDVTAAVAAVIADQTKRIGFRFQVDPQTPYGGNQAFMDAEDADDTTKPYLLIVEGAPGDYDGNGVLDLADHAAFTDCMDGPGTPAASGCSVFDFDADTDVDLADYEKLLYYYQLFFQG